MQVRCIVFFVNLQLLAISHKGARSMQEVQPEAKEDRSRLRKTSVRKEAPVVGTRGASVHDKLPGNATKGTPPFETPFHSDC